MVVFAPSKSAPRVSSEQTRTLFRDTLRRHVELLESGKARYHVPTSKHRYERFPGKMYHFKPEMFIQLAGATEFTLPESGFRLAENEICVMPRGVPHGEVTQRGTRPFENVVVCYYNETVAIHVAHETADRTPVVDDIFFFRTSLYKELVEYLDRIAELALHNSEACAAATRGLLLAELALLLAVVEEGETERFSDSERVFRCEWLIRNNISDTELSLEFLAEQLHCSPDHLSRIFHEETGERVVEYLNRLRLQGALEAIRTTLLSVKEVAVSCGFNDASYFARVFRKVTGCSPQEYRRNLQRISCAVEKEPKAVFYDHAEHDFGLQPEVMAKAEVRTLS